VVFSRYYAHPTCTPSRAALMTGMYGANTGLALAAMPASIVGLPPDMPTLPQLLSCPAAAWRATWWASGTSATQNNQFL